MDFPSHKVFALMVLSSRCLLGTGPKGSKASLMMAKSQEVSNHKSEAIPAGKFQI